MSQGTDLVVGDGNHAQALEIAQELIAGEMQLDFRGFSFGWQRAC